MKPRKIGVLTQKGRVVYARKKHTLTGLDMIRLLTTIINEDRATPVNLNAAYRMISREWYNRFYKLLETEPIQIEPPSLPENLKKLLNVDWIIRHVKEWVYWLFSSAPGAIAIRDSILEILDKIMEVYYGKGFNP